LFGLAILGDDSEWPSRGMLRGTGDEVAIDSVSNEEKAMIYANFEDTV
jgi:hypothetical protein